MMDLRRYRFAAAVTGVALLAFITYASLSPIQDRPVVASQGVEHMTAFGLLALLLAFALPRHRLHVVAALLVIVGGLELSQMLVPGRHGRIVDLGMKLFGTIGGLLAALALDDVLARLRVRR